MTQNQETLDRPSPASSLDILCELQAGLVVFLVALPLCLGIAMASGAPLISGLISGMIGGLVVAPLSGSCLSVSGPAAGLIVLVAEGIQDQGSWNAFASAVVICGLLQILFGLVRLGRVGEFFPTSVIKGMLSAIGIVIIMKQIPHALGRDVDPEGDLAFIGVMGENSLTEILRAIHTFNATALAIATLSMLIIVSWPTLSKHYPKLRLIPAQLVAVVAGVLCNDLLVGTYFPAHMLSKASGNLVDLPTAASLEELIGFIALPDAQAFLTRETWMLGAVLAVIASIETLLSVEAVDKLDPYSRISDTNQELYAQGAGNLLAGFLGALPLTAVIVRSSANVYAGAKTKLSAFVHGIFLLVAVLFLPSFMNHIPIAALAAILIQVGYKLAHPVLFRQMYARGSTQFTPFIVTIIAVVTTDLLTGVLVGFAVGIYFVIKANRHSTITMVQDGIDFLMRFNKDMSFIDRAELKEHLLSLPDDANLIVDGIKAQYIDQDILDVLNDFEKSAGLRGIRVSFTHIHTKMKL